MNKLWKTADDAVFTQFVGDLCTLGSCQRVFFCRILA